MPGILDRLDPIWIRASENQNERRYTGGEISAFMRMHADGQLTSAEIKSRLGLDTDGIAEWDWLEGRYTAASDKLHFVQSLTSSLTLLRSGYYSQAEVLNTLNASL